MNFSELSPQYLAGLIDGEGCLMITRLKKVPEYKSGRFRYAPVLTITNTHLPLLQSIQMAWGGRIREGIKGSGVYTIYFNSSQMRKLVPFFYPYLVIKKDQAELLMDYLDSLKKNGPKSLSDEQYDKYGSYWQRLKDMKAVRFTNSIELA